MLSWEVLYLDGDGCVGVICVHALNFEVVLWRDLTLSRSLRLLLSEGSVLFRELSYFREEWALRKSNPGSLVALAPWHTL